MSWGSWTLVVQTVTIWNYTYHGSFLVEESFVIQLFLMKSQRFQVFQLFWVSTCEGKTWKWKKAMHWSMNQKMLSRCWTLFKVYIIAREIANFDLLLVLTKKIIILEAWLVRSPTFVRTINRPLLRKPGHDGTDMTCRRHLFLRFTVIVILRY